MTTNTFPHVQVPLVGPYLSQGRPLNRNLSSTSQKCQALRLCPAPPDAGRSAAGLAEGQLTQVWLFVVIDATEQAVFTQLLAGWMGSPNPCVIVSSNPRDVSGRRVSDEQIASHQSGINTCAITEAPADSAGENTRRRGGSTKATEKMCHN